MSEQDKRRAVWVESRLRRIQAKLENGELEQLLAYKMALCIMLEFSTGEEADTHGEVTQKV